MRTANNIYSVATGPTIRVVVGSSKEEFTIHEHLAKSKSKYFSTALSGPWQETQQRTFELAEQNVSVFTSFVNYLYSEGVKFDVAAPAEAIEIFLIECYLLGERRSCASYRRAVLLALSTIFGRTNFPSINAMMLAFIESREKSTLRRYIVDLCVWDVTSSVRTAILEGTLEESMAPGFRDEFLKAMLLRDKERNSVHHNTASQQSIFNLDYDESSDEVQADSPI